MGSVPPELSLDLRPTFVPKTISDFLHEVSAIGNAADKLSRFDEFLKRLEEEMMKIDVFKPPCFLMVSSFDRWEKDPFFTAAEEVQGSADRS
ncbi:hypothetical protein K1719_024693 [Acacia pycnantha]|nr:hypothetical protein K1719_024693 [Acacia pycnantha]